ncbi:MAG: response regulator [Gemmatimonadota bacterium]|jgi:CheY-like chemotaxis protein
MPDGVKTVLVVDDDPDAVDFFVTVLEDNGYQTVSARDGNEALDRIQERIPDLITLDVTMPEKSGVGVYRKLRETEEYEGIPVIIITGVSDDFKQFISSRRQVPPPEGYLSKPIESADLLGLVKDLVG